MENFQTAFETASRNMDADVKNEILQSHLQYSDATRVFGDKSKSDVVEKGTYTRKILGDAVFSLRSVCDQLFKVVLKLSENQSGSDVERMAKKVEDMFNTRFDNFTQQISPTRPDTNIPAATNLQKEKHVIVIKDKNSDAKYNAQTWSTVVKGSLESQLKEIPVNRSLLNKAGAGCLFFPNKKAQEDAQSVLEPLYNVETSTTPVKDILPKIKIFDVDSAVYAEKDVLKQAIKVKNPDVSTLLNNGCTLDVILINTAGNYAIIKVSPEIRKVLMNQGKIFLGMQSLRIRDHFQPLQCFACQGLGHKQGSEDCKFHGADTAGNTCLYCSGNHRSRDCEHKKDRNKHTCVNCKHSSKPEHRANSNHTSTSLKCPFVIKEINALIKRTSGLSETEAKNLRIQMSSK